MNIRVVMKTSLVLRNRFRCIPMVCVHIILHIFVSSYVGSSVSTAFAIPLSMFNVSDCDAASMVPVDITLRKGFQRIQEASRNAFEHAGAQQLKRIAPNHERPPTASPHRHAYRSSSTF